MESTDAIQLLFSPPPLLFWVMAFLPVMFLPVAVASLTSGLDSARRGMSLILIALACVIALFAPVPLENKAVLGIYLIAILATPLMTGGGIVMGFYLAFFQPVLYLLLGIPTILRYVEFHNHVQSLYLLTLASTTAIAFLFFCEYTGDAIQIGIVTLIKIYTSFQIPYEKLEPLSRILFPISAVLGFLSLLLHVGYVITEFISLLTA